MKLSLFSQNEQNQNIDYSEIFEDNKLYQGRMISQSKSGYIQLHPNNIIVFNANIITKKAGKIWYGDLDVTLDFDKLKNIADEIGEDFYILRELDARFDNQNIGFDKWKTLAVTVIKTNDENHDKI